MTLSSRTASSSSGSTRRATLSTPPLRLLGGAGLFLGPRALHPHLLLQPLPLHLDLLLLGPPRRLPRLVVPQDHARRADPARGAGGAVTGSGAGALQGAVRGDGVDPAAHVGHFCELLGWVGGELQGSADGLLEGEEDGAVGALRDAEGGVGACSVREARGWRWRSSWNWGSVRGVAVVAQVLGESPGWAALLSVFVLGGGGGLLERRRGQERWRGSWPGVGLGEDSLGGAVEALAGGGAGVEARGAADGVDGGGRGGSLGVGRGVLWLVLGLLAVVLGRGRLGNRGGRGG